jgi:hypothetical protein
MSKDTSNSVATGLVVLFVGALLLSSPRCDRGCRTVGEHLVTHGLEELLAIWGL